MEGNPRRLPAVSFPTPSWRKQQPCPRRAQHLCFVWRSPMPPTRPPPASWHCSMFREAHRHRPVCSIRTRELEAACPSHRTAKDWFIRFRKMGWRTFGCNPWTAPQDTRSPTLRPAELANFIGRRTAENWPCNMKKRQLTWFCYTILGLERRLRRRNLTADGQFFQLGFVRHNRPPAAVASSRQQIILS